MANANDLPQDLWELIAFYLSWPMRKSLIGLNRQMLNIVLDERYRTVTWDDPIGATVKKLKHLCAPETASHVRCLHLPGWFMRRLLDIPLDSVAAHGSSPKSTPLKFLQKAPRLASINSWFSGNEPSTTSSPKPRPIAGTTEDTESVLKVMHESMGKMRNLREFHVEWRDLPLSLSARAFLASANNAFKHNLVKLILSGTCSRIEIMMAGLITPPRLEELEIQFDYNPRTPEATARNEDVFANIVAPYINHLKPTLRTLKIKSFASGDHSQLFQALTHLPALRTLSIRVSFESEHLSDASALLTFLRAHIFEFRHLEIIPHRTDSGVISPDWPAFYQKLVATSPWFPNLASVSITSPSPAAANALIQRLPSTITSVQLLHRSFTEHEVISIAKAIGSQAHLLYNFSIDVTVLTHDLLINLAASFPALYSLTLVVQFETIPFFYSHQATLLGQVPEAMQPIDWNLYDLSIYLKHLRENSLSRQDAFESREEACMKMVYRAVPSIKTFRGRDHTDPAYAVYRYYARLGLTHSF